MPTFEPETTNLFLHNPSKRMPVGSWVDGSSALVVVWPDPRAFNKERARRDLTFEGGLKKGTVCGEFGDKLVVVHYGRDEIGG